MQFFSRHGQDRFLFENFFRGNRSGTFLELCTAQGEADIGPGNNSLFFERYLGWRGLWVGPQNRPPPVGRTCRHEQLSFSGLDLPALLARHNLTRVDYCSIDATAADSALLAALDPERVDIRTLTISASQHAESIARLMEAKGYQLIARLGTDCVFTRRGVTRLPWTTVICAVWHADPRRQQLLAGHVRNLAAQTVPIDSVYVFDGGDRPPPDLNARHVVVHENLRIYQAWNVALSLVATPLVMNLNLDDRLAPDAIERLQAALSRDGATLVGGDWKICYSQEETDAVERCYPATQLPFVTDWPPPSGTRTRLGSGTGSRGTLGPATMWRVDAHLGAPRYPWRLSDGTPLETVGDAAWWSLIGEHLKKKTSRLPEIIGNYHSHPADQAEFRGPPGELALMAEVGISLL